MLNRIQFIRKILISVFTVVTENMIRLYGPIADIFAERAEWTKEFIENAFSCLDYIGWHMCGMIDTWKTMEGKEKAQHQGLMTVTGDFYPEMEKAVKDISDHLYLSAQNQK